MFSKMFIFEECLNDKILLNMYLNINIICI